MKKMIFLFVCMLSMSSIVLADTDKPIQIGELPTKAQTFITTYFKTLRLPWLNRKPTCSSRVTM